VPVYRLSDELVFPPPSHAEPDGLLAVGGDLRLPRLLLAYCEGIFPWSSAREPLLWWSPDPRFVLFPDALHVPRSLRRTLRRAPWRLTADTAFDEVVARCAAVRRPGQRGTWITRPMRLAYGEAHRAGFAHSVEAWEGERLVGGLYGLEVGRCFSGESMFAAVPDASKAAFVAAVGFLRSRGCDLIDCQMETDHLRRFGAGPVPRARFLQRLRAALVDGLAPGSWTEAFAAGAAALAADGA